MNRDELIAECRKFEQDFNVLPSQYVVAAGGAVLLLGGRVTTEDIDISVGYDVWDRVSAGRELKHIPGVVPIACIGNIDAHIDPESMLQDRVVVDGLNIQAPHVILAMKQKLNRPKDQADISFLQAYIQTH